ncbi:hypothetical protein DL771_011999 [Monosporascus sp. 5C6A]|nr:hypothetical protein DL771_011999 [Monosporascus sp. 5C6A]
MAGRPIPRKKDAARDHPASSLATSFRSGSPFANEILASDIAECSGDGDAADGDFRGGESGSDTGSQGGADCPVLYKQPQGVAYGVRRPSILPERVHEVTLNEAERMQSLDAERSLLRDNHILPPKHGGESGLSPFSRLYRRMFSTKVPKGAGSHEEAPGGSVDPPSESTPLLAGADETPGHLNEQWESAVASGKIKTTWQREAQTIAVYSRSLIVTFLLQYSINVASIFAVGRIGKVELGAVTLASMTANITCYAPMQGLATSLDTLCAQAYGSGHKHLVGLQLQRMTYFLWLITLPIAVVFFFGGSILRLIVPEPETAELAGLYLRVIIVGIPGFAAFEGGKRFVQAQGLFTATTYVLLIAAPLNVLVNWLFVWHFGWGFIGAPIAVAFTQLLMPGLLFAYVVYVDGYQCWGGFSRRAVTNWGPMIWLALPGMIMVEAEWFAFEVLTLMVSRFGTSYLAAQSILVTLTATTFQIPFPVSIAASTRVANLIGARLVDAAKTSAKVGLYAAFAIGVFNLALLASLRYQLPLLFTRDEEVMAIVADVMPLCAAMQVFDALTAMAHGLLRGIGKQSVGGYVNLASYYLVGLPISAATAFALDWRLWGLWLGPTVGLFLVSVIEYWYVYNWDWEQSVRDAERRNANA